MIKVKTFTHAHQDLRHRTGAAGPGRAGHGLPQRRGRRRGLLRERYSHGRRQRRDHRPHPHRRLQRGRLSRSGAMRQRGTRRTRHRDPPRGAAIWKQEAVARYVKHGSATADPRLFAYWESLRRNEADHRDAPRGVNSGATASACRRGAVVSAAGLRPRSRRAARRLRVRGRRREAVRPDGRRGRDDPTLAALFKELARGEAGHRRGLRNMIARSRTPRRLWYCSVRSAAGRSTSDPTPPKARKASAACAPAASPCASTTQATGPWRDWRRDMTRHAPQRRPPDAGGPRRQPLAVERVDQGPRDGPPSTTSPGFRRGRRRSGPLEREELGPLVHDGTTCFTSSATSDSTR